ncbi:MAG TPA: hypothetical protein VN805_07920 [Caulobacteraceae bacterium]|nr:hypothetical protein [Caulobacteraceae bacterium]
MNADAFAVLEAIGRGSRVELPDGERWIEAFKTIRWAVEGQNGPILTPEGRRARDQMALERRTVTGQAKRSNTEPRRAALG